MSTDSSSWSTLVGKKIVLTLHDQTTIEGTLTRVGANGVLVKSKGSPVPNIFETEKIDSIDPDQSIEQLKSIPLKPVTAKTVRRHLLNYHGQTLTLVNNLSEEIALEFHEEFHTEGKDLGHTHTSQNDSEGETE